MTFSISTDDCDSDISIISNTIDNKTTPFVFVGEGRTNNCIVMDNSFYFNKKKFGGKIKFENLIVE